MRARRVTMGLLLALLCGVSLADGGPAVTAAPAAGPAAPAAATASPAAATASPAAALPGQGAPQAAQRGILPEFVPGSGFAQADAPRAFEFPLDHGPHPQFRQEWWYLTGNLDGPGGERFGFELTFFRVALAPPGIQSLPSDAQSPPPDAQSPAAPSAWRTRELYLAHFAVTDVAQRRFVFASKLSRAALGLAGAQVQPLRVWIDDWSLRAEAGADAGASAPWRMHAAQPDYELQLTLEAASAPVSNGEGGLSRKSAEPGSASYYYSMPRLRARGQLTRGGQVLAVSGLAWFDREWGSGGLGANEVGWDWYALQLQDGAALMFYALRERDGSSDPHSAGTYISAAGDARVLGRGDVMIDVTAHWADAQRVRYPSAWRVRVPSAGLDVRVLPVLADQELKTTPQYWEGAVDVSGSDAHGPVSGRGYVELVGYAGER